MVGCASWTLKLELLICRDLKTLLRFLQQSEALISTMTGASKRGSSPKALSCQKLDFQASTHQVVYTESRV